MPDTVPGSGGQVEKGEYMEFCLRYSLFHREIKRFINYGIKFAVYGDFFQIYKQAPEGFHLRE